MNMRSVRTVRRFALGIVLALVVAACGTTSTPTLYALSVTVGGTGDGTVTSAPAGIDTAVAGGNQADFEDGTAVTLTASAAAGSTFTGWGGACASAVGTTCAVTVDAAKTATATFDEVVFALSVTVDGTGSGSVTSSPSGIDTSVAGGDEADFAEGTVVTLTASAEAGSEFAGWGGACATAVGTTCDVDMTADRNAFATFDLLLGTLFFSQDGNANGLYVIDMATGSAALSGAGTTTVNGSTVGLAGRGATDDLIGSQPFALLDIAQDGSGATQFSGITAEGLTYVASSDLVYAILNGAFQSVSPTTGLQVEDLADPGFDLEGLAADEASGVIYAIGNDTNLWAYNIQFDAWAIVFDTGINWFLGGLAYSDVEDILYAIGAGDNEDGVYRIDPVAETVTLVGSTGLVGPNEGGLAWVPAP